MRGIKNKGDQIYNDGRFDFEWSMESIQMIQRATSMGNWWLAVSSQQHACSCIKSHAEFLAKHQIAQVTQPPYSPALAPCDFWLFPKLKSPLKGKRFQTINDIQEHMTGHPMAIGRTVWGPNFDGDWGIIVLCIMFLVSWIFFNKCLYFFF